MTNDDLLNQVQAIVSESPTYRTGGSGADGTCDCVGLIMGAMVRAGHGKYPIHSSNYFARFQTDAIRPIEDFAQLAAGMLVYKARADQADLNARYQQGGRYYNGDLLDYYHVGVITEMDPFTITHCTSTGAVNGITTDQSTKGWTHAGFVSGVEYLAEDGAEEEIEPTERTYRVTAESGATVNLRVKPSTGSAVIRRVPIGEKVTGEPRGDTWHHVVDSTGRAGYMQSRYLDPAEETEAPDLEQRVTELEGQMARVMEMLNISAG